MYVIRSHEVLITAVIGNEHYPSEVGLEVRPPLNPGETDLILNWAQGHNRKSVSQFICRLSHADDASRYGEQVNVAHTHTTINRVYELAQTIRQGIESGGKFVSVEYSERKMPDHDILGS